MNESKCSIQSKILGTWKLVRYTMTPKNSEDSFFFPYGENAMGYLIYTPEQVSVHIMRAERSQSADLAEEKREAAENYAGYVGRYEIEAERIIHYPEVCGWVSFLHTPQVRFFEFQNDQLILTCTFFHKERGCQVDSELIWQKL